ncbi:MAG TPA: SDR family NAD(P)-dependent oxidoreductase [Arthrobacter sp.]|nr:SDR family NAD(P)-dependent oxidoreductase [Arthrobacter sp.]
MTDVLNPTELNGDQIRRDVTNSVTLITGGARGTGKEAAKALLSLGGYVAVLDVNKERVDSVADELDASAEHLLPILADCTDRENMAIAVTSIVERFGKLTNVVYCAGAYRAQRPSLDIDGNEWDLIVDSNLKGAFFTDQAAIPEIERAGGGSVVHIASLAGRTSSPFLGCHYSSAKAGILGLTRHFAKEFGPAGIRFNAICPGGIRGQRMTDLVTELHREGDLTDMANQTPLGRNVLETDVVGSILFFLSHLSGFVTGATLDVNGGILTI